MRAAIGAVQFVHAGEPTPAIALINLRRWSP